MKVIVFGATGMVGQGVVRECLEDPSITGVLLVGRSPANVQHAKLRELVRKDLFDYAGCDTELQGYDACFFCLGVSSAGMKEADYRRITYDLTLAAAKTLVRLNPGMTFIYVSGEGTDANGSSMWSRVKGKTENDLQGLGFKATYMFRPGFIRPLDGITSRTRVYRVMYALMRPFVPLIAAIAPKFSTDTRKVGRAMIHVTQKGFKKPVLATVDINEAAA